MKTFTFGKYKGRSIMSVLDENPAYVEWCINNIKWFSLDDTEQKSRKPLTLTMLVLSYVAMRVHIK